MPEARIAIGHGQMGDDQLENVMVDFVAHKYDVLLATTIIENGLDIPNANTMLINRADRYGLSQLYQLRGRVGRSDRRAYAYLLIPPEEALSAVAKKRLAAIREFSDLGSGFRVAALDLEIRGAGNLLGGEQSGHIEAVGFDMYMKLLEQTIKELKGEEIEDEIRANVNLRVDLRIDDEFIPDMNQRLTVYRRFAAVRNDAELDRLMDEVWDRYGNPPASVLNLAEYAAIRLIAARLGIESIEAGGEEHHGGQVEPFGAEPVGGPAGERDDAREGQGVADHRPRDLRGGGVELVLEGLEGHRDDGDVEDGHDRAEHDHAGDDEDFLVELVVGWVGADLALDLVKELMVTSTHDGAAGDRSHRLSSVAGCDTCVRSGRLRRGPGSAPGGRVLLRGQRLGDVLERLALGLHTEECRDDAAGDHQRRADVVAEGDRADPLTTGGGVVDQLAEQQRAGDAAGGGADRVEERDAQRAGLHREHLAGGEVRRAGAGRGEEEDDAAHQGERDRGVGVQGQAGDT